MLELAYHMFKWMRVNGGVGMPYGYWLRVKERLGKPWFWWKYGRHGVWVMVDLKNDLHARVSCSNGLFL